MTIQVVNNHFLVSLEADDFLKCETFTTNVVNTNLEQYAKRGQKDPKAIYKQIMEGKLAEIAVEKLMKSLGIKTSEVDFGIYDKKHKSWAPDLVTDFGSVHVKSMCTKQAKKYTLSWTFQAGRSWDTDKLISQAKEDDYIALVEVNDTDYTQPIKIVGLINFNHILANDLLKHPKLPQLLGIKKVLYYTDIQDLIVTTLWSAVEKKYQESKVFVQMHENEYWRN